jgi:hypothetical protein
VLFGLQYGRNELFGDDFFEHAAVVRALIHDPWHPKHQLLGVNERTAATPNAGTPTGTPSTMQEEAVIKAAAHAIKLGGAAAARPRRGKYGRRGRTRS